MGTVSLSSSYLPHINGLRAIAILGILLYHLREDYCPAGYFGVDLFLVISGFLLFRSLLKSGEEREFHYGSYLLKKAWRIIPSWFVVTCVVGGVSFWLFAPARLLDVVRTARASATFSADYYIDSSGDYFNVFSKKNPFLHYWYLSVIQQLYILAPLLIIPLVRWCSRRAAIVLLAVLTILSLTYYVLTTSYSVPSSFRELLLSSLGTTTPYYHLVPRFWEIAAGAAVFLLPEFTPYPKLRTLLGGLSLIGILLTYYLYSTGSPYIYLTVIFSLLALRYASSGIAARLLSSKPLQLLGTISFSLYLWHWPVMVFWKYCCFDVPGVWGELGMIALSLALAAVSWWGIESMRMPSRAGWKGILLRCSVLVLIVLVQVPSTKLNKYVRKQLSRQVRIVQISTSETETDKSILCGLEDASQHFESSAVWRIGSDAVQPTFFMLGDSHAAQIYDAMHEHCKSAGIRGLYIRKNLTPCWNLNQTGSGYWNQSIAELLLNYLRQHENIRYVIIAQYWEYRLSGLFLENREVTPEVLNTERITESVGQDWRTGEQLTTPRTRLNVTEPGVAELCERIRALGKEVILLGDNPGFTQPSPFDEWERCQQFHVPYVGRHVTPKQHEQNQAGSLRFLRKLQAEGRVHYLDLAPALLQDGIYPDRDKEEFLYMDTHHLTPLGARRVVDYIMPQLLALMKPGEQD